MQLTWKNAEAWENWANADKEGDYAEPQWKWDCNFKLDFDGPLLRISSRFYPPHKNKHDGWEGTVCVVLIEKEIEEKEFIAPNLDDLKRQVEEYVQNVISRVKINPL